MSIRKQQLKELKEKNILVKISTDKYDESYIGFIQDFKNELLVLDTFNDDCIYDGLKIFKQINISRIRWEGNDLLSVSKLIDKNKRKNKSVKLNLTSTKSLLSDIKSKFNHITIHIQDLNNDICFIGEVEVIDSETIIIHEFGTNKSLDRQKVMISLDDITKIDIDGVYENQLLKLFEKQLKK